MFHRDLSLRACMRRDGFFICAILPVVALLRVSALHAQGIPSEITVYARANTGAVSEDADDPAIWIHPADPAKSLIIGTDKAANFVYVWDMNGQQLQRVSVVSYPNNGDVRYGMPVGGVATDIYAVGSATPSRLVVFKIDPNTLTLSDITTAGGIPVPQVTEPYGVCLYRRKSDGAMFAFLTSNGGIEGVVHQYQLLDDGAGKVKGAFVRSFGGEFNGKQSEGLVADDEHGYLYVAQESCCVHKFHADPDKGNDRLAVFAQGDGIQGDREGLGIYACADGTGYILLSSQGNRRVKVYRREGEAGNPHSHTLLTTIFTPEVAGTDGLEITNRPAGPNFPFGLLAKHNSTPRNYALFAWEDIAQSYLTICPEASPACAVTAEFSAPTTSGYAPMQVDFTDLSTGAPTSWLWHFGDGQTSTQQNPSHVYAAAGAYSVSLIASAASCSDTVRRANYITVTVRPPGNLALGRPASASSSVLNFLPARAVDGVAGDTSYWRSAAVSRTAPNTWLRVDLLRPRLLSRATVKWRGIFFAKKYRFQISNTGGNAEGEWTTVHTNEAGTAGTKDAVFEAPFAARFFRIRMDENNEGNNQIYELECHGALSSTAQPFLPEHVLPASTPVFKANRPNPFHAATLLQFELPQTQRVVLKIYNVAGQEVAALADGELEAGSHQIRFEAAHLPSGLYLAVLQAGAERQTRRLIVMK